MRFTICEGLTAKASNSEPQNIIPATDSVFTTKLIILTDIARPVLYSSI